MRRYAPWCLSTAGLFLLVLLYGLPRWVVDAKSKETADAIVKMHALPMDIGVRMDLARWKANWRQDHKWQWADSIAYTYLQYERIDTALRYVQHLQRSGASFAKRRAGLHLYRAHLLSSDSAQQLRLAGLARRQLQTAASLFPERL